LFVVSTVVAGVAITSRDEGRHDPAQISTGTDAKALSGDSDLRSPEAVRRDVATMLDRMLDDHPDPVGWGAPDGSVVYISKSDYRRILETDLLGQVPIMIPATDAAGEVRAYVAIQLGVIPKDAAEAPGFNLSAEVAEAKDAARRYRDQLDRRGEDQG
jgi:PHD/YefM family antitoxin component YafN of YafNO toxin-antitoxin module